MSSSATPSPSSRSSGAALRSGLGIREGLRDVLAVGAAYLPYALDEGFRQRVQRELQGVAFERLPRRMGPVTTEADLFVARGQMLSCPRVGELREELVAALRRADSELAGWWPNEAYVQRYWPQSLGVSPHKDSRRFAFLVAVFTIEGSARFGLCADRAGRRVQEWDASPGSLILLRGPGLGGIDDGRPFHTVAGPEESQRVSVTFRMNTTT